MLLRFFHSSHQGPEPDATGYKGFYYHLLDMQTGCRALQCELSTVDTGILMAGVLTAAAISPGRVKKKVKYVNLLKFFTGALIGSGP